MSKELAVKNVYDFMVPTDYESALKISHSFADSSLVPDHFKKKPTDVLVAISWGAQLGLSPIIALNGICVIKGRPSLWGSVFWGVILSSPKYIKHEELWDDLGKEWTVTIWKQGSDKPYTGTFSYEDAKTAKLWGKAGSWTEYPKDMCLWKARSRAGKAGFSDALCGISMAEEVIDITIQDKPTPPSFDTNTFSGAQTKPTETPEETPPEAGEVVDAGGECEDHGVYYTDTCEECQDQPTPPEEPKAAPTKEQIVAAKAEEKKKKAAEKKAAKEAKEKAQPPKEPKESPSKIRDRVAGFIQDNSSLYPEIKKLLTGVFPDCGNIDGAYLNHENLRDANTIPDKDIQTINDVLIGNEFYK